MPSVSHEHPKTTILFVGDPPKFDNQLRDGHPFSGKVSVYFKDGIESAELPSTMFEKTFCCVSDDIEKLNTPKQQTAAAQTSLYPKLIETKPLVVVCCGASALKVVCGDKYKIKDWAGKHFAFEFEHDGKKITFLVFVSWSPGFLIHNDHLLEEYYGHFKKIKSLAENYDKELSKQAESAELDYAICQDFDSCMREIKKFDKVGAADGLVAWDLETSGLNPHAKHSRIGVLSLSSKARTASVFIWDHVESAWSKVEKKRWLKRLRTFFRNKYKFIAHNGKFDGKWVKKKCGVFPRLFADTMLMSWILNENPGNHGLKQLAVKYTDLGNYEDELGQYIPDKSAFCAFLTPPIHVVARYAAMDADVCIRCYEAMLPQIQKKLQYRKLAERLLPQASQYLAAMEYNGAKVDLAYAQEYADELTKISDELMGKIRKNGAVQRFVVERQEEQDAEYQQYIDDKMAGHKAKVREWKRAQSEHDEVNAKRAQEGKRPLKFTKKKPNWETLVKRKVPDRFQFNLNSGDQLRAVLFEKMRYNPLMETDSGLPSTNKETLIHYKNEQGCKFSATLLDYRLYSKILSTYITPMLSNTVGYDTGHYVYGSFNLTSTVTGRLSANNPNLQNVGSKGGGGVKRCYTTRFDGGCLVAVDYSQIELRLAACISKDKRMLKLYRDGADIHETTMFGIYSMTHDEYKALDKIKQKEMRRVAKVYNFGVCCLEDTPVLTENRGWVPIQDALVSDRVWDGTGWVTHEGVSMNGVKDVIEVDGIWCTKDHQILTEKGWAEAWQVRANTLNPPKGRYTDSGQFVLSGEGPTAGLAGSGLCAPVATAGSSTFTLLQDSSTEVAPGALNAQVRSCETPEHSLTDTRKSCPTRPCANDGSDAGTICSEGAITPYVPSTTTTEVGGSVLAIHGETGRSSFDTSRPSRTGTSQERSSTVSTMTETMNPETSGLSAPAPISEIPGEPRGSNTGESGCTCESFTNSTAPSIDTSTTLPTSSRPGCLSTTSSKGKNVAEVRTGRVYDLVNAGPNHRYQAGKHIVHNCYGMGPQGIVAALRKDDPPVRVTDDEAVEAFKKFHRTYKGLSKWLDLTHGVVRQNGWVDSMFGRRRRLPEVRSSDEAAVARAERQGANHIIQSSASDMTLVSGIIIWKEMKKRKMKSLPVITVHDSIIFDVYPGEAQQVIDLAKEVMTNLPKHGWKVMGKDFDWSFLICPIEIGIDVGYNWRDLIELGSETKDGVKIETVEQALKESAHKRAEADKTEERDDYGDKAALADVRENLEDDKEVA